MINKTFTVAGLMSGTSLDGLDIAICSFECADEKWNYKTIAATTIEYSDAFKIELNNAMRLPGEELIVLDRSFGTFQGNALSTFLKDQHITIDMVASHGHTIFHNPQKGYTFQIGSGATLYAACGLPVVTDLRSVDVAFGGQGAPLVPLGDELLFGSYSACLNLGGIANVSFLANQNNIAFDICPVNILLNAYTTKIGKAYDDKGHMAKSGTCIQALLVALNEISFYNSLPPKSIGREWVDSVVFPILDGYQNHRIEDILNTLVLHSATQIATSLNEIPIKNQRRDVLVTGGGAFNSFLIETIRSISNSNITLVIPDTSTIQFKEAIIFGFLGLLRIQNLTNARSTVTGASSDTIGGAIYGSTNELFS